MSESEDGRGEFVKAGYLVKSPPVSRAYVSQWHRRWFLLMDSRLVYPLAERYVRLVYYQSEADAKRFADPKGSINLNSCLSVVSSSLPIKHYKFVFDVCTTERVYHLCADSEEERCDWVSTLKQLLFHSPQIGRSARPTPTPVLSKSPEIARRSRESPKMQRPVSFTTNVLSESKGRGVQARPLPPVPGSVSISVPSSPVERKKRPLPAPPVSGSQGVHVNPVGLQLSPLIQKRISSKPEKPVPYRKNKSEPAPPDPPQPSQFTRSVSLSPPPSLGLAEDYQEFVSQSSSQAVCSIDNYDVRLDLNAATEDNNYSLATSVPRQQIVGRKSPQVSCSNDDYSVLESTVVHGYDPSDQDYSHLEPVVSDSPPPPIRYSSLATHHGSDTSLHKPRQKPRISPRNHGPHNPMPDYVNCPSSPNDDYSILHH